MCLDEAKIRHPFCDCELARLAKEASEKDTNLTSCRGILLMVIFVCLWSFASWSKRLASPRSLTVALLILACNKLSLADKSGRVLVAAYCTLPMRPLKACRSFSVTSASGSCRRLRSMSIAGMSSTYFPVEIAPRLPQGSSRPASHHLWYRLEASPDPDALPLQRLCLRTTCKLEERAEANVLGARYWQETPVVSCTHWCRSLQA